MEDFSEMMAIKYPHFFKNFPAASIPAGWRTIFLNMVEDIDIYINKIPNQNIFWENPSFDHVMGKPNVSSESIMEILESYENLSKTTCSVCGTRSDILPTRWVDTRCRAHANV